MQYNTAFAKMREREREEGRVRRICRKWYSIAAGKDAESGPQLYGGRCCASPFSWRDWRRAVTHHAYSRFRNNNYLIPEATGEMRAVQPEEEREKEGPVLFRPIS